MSLIIRFHMAMVMWHLSWLNFWLHWEPDTTAGTKRTKYPHLVQWTVDDAGETAATADHWLRQQVWR